jgi:hypothetical protein
MMSHRATTFPACKPVGMQWSTADGTPDTRGITEKAADAITGDRTDDKTGRTV